MHLLEYTAKYWLDAGVSHAVRLAKEVVFSTAGKRRSRSPHEGLGVGVGLGEGGEKGKKRVSLEPKKI